MKLLPTFFTVKHLLIFIGIILLVVISKVVTHQVSRTAANSTETNIISGSIDKAKLKSDEEWEKILTPEQYHILREQGTETPYTGELNTEKRKGTYYSVGCDQPLFRSDTKYESGTGWPSFWSPIDSNSLVLREDTSIVGKRIEVLDTCGNHLGHVFDDGPQPTGKRYCMNSLALRFQPD